MSVSGYLRLPSGGAIRARRLPVGVCGYVWLHVTACSSSDRLRLYSIPGYISLSVRRLVFISRYIRLQLPTLAIGDSIPLFLAVRGCVCYSLVFMVVHRCLCLSTYLFSYPWLIRGYLFMAAYLLLWWIAVFKWTRHQEDVAGQKSVLAGGSSSPLLDPCRLPSARQSFCSLSSTPSSSDCN